MTLTVAKEYTLELEHDDPYIMSISINNIYDGRNLSGYTYAPHTFNSRYSKLNMGNARY